MDENELNVEGTLWEILEVAALRARGGLTFVEGESHTWAQVRDRAANVSNGLHGLGLEKGDTVALFMPSTLDFVATFFAAIRLGITVAPIGVDLPAPSIDRALVSLGAGTLIYADELSAVMSELQSNVSRVSSKELHSLAQVHVGEASPSPSAPRDLAFLLMTSGTTGAPKAVMYSHSTALRFAATAWWNLEFGPDDVVYTCLPFNHGAGLLCEFLGGLLSGASVVVAQRFSVSRYWSHLADYRVTKTNTLGSITLLLLRTETHPDEGRHCLKRVRRSGTNEETTKAFESRFNVQTTEMYGLNDTGLILAIPPGVHRTDTCGRVIEGWDVRVVDVNNQGEHSARFGELLVRPQHEGIMPLGYRDQDGTFGSAMRDGWFSTGDVVEPLPDGWFRYVGRSKDVIRRSGENVAPIEVETVLLGHASIAEVAVFAVPSELGEDEVMAVCVPARDQFLEASDLRNWALKSLPYYAVPRYWRFVDELPKTPTAKVMVSELRQTGVTTDTFDLGRMARKRPSQESEEQNA